MSVIRKPHQAPAPADEIPAPLFRQESIDEQNSQWLGNVVIEDQRFYRIIAMIAGATLVAVFLLIVFGGMSRKVAVTGVLMPQQGLARIVATQPGIVEALHVREGMAVKKGTPLITISGELKTRALDDARFDVIKSLQSRKDSLSGTISAQNVILEQQTREIEARLASLQLEKKHLERELDLQRARVDLGRRQVKRESEMRARGLIPLPRLERTQQEELDQSSRLQSLERSFAALRREIISAENQLRDMPHRKKTQIGELERSVSGLQQELVEAEARYTSVMTAPSDGIVTALSVDLGSTVNSASVLMTIVPQNAVLQAMLFSPSTGIGFVQPGQRVKLRIQAFPYQKFGFQEGEVATVARAASAVSELPAHVASPVSPAGAEPVFKIVAALPSQTVRAYGSQIALQAGMRVDADIIVERRSLLEWMFDPLLAITGKWG